MVWKLEEIQREWLLGAVIDFTPERLVDAFNRTEAIFGRPWIERVGNSRGAAPALVVATMGQKLAALEDVVGAEKLIDHIKAGERFAHAELTAVYILRGGHPQTDAEIYPRVRVGSRQREPDFRIRQAGELWTYVEVAHPDLAETQERAHVVLERLCRLISSITKQLAFEVFLLREPNDDEIEELETASLAFCSQQGAQRQLIGDLAVLILNDTSPGFVAVGTHPEDDGRPRIGMSKVIGGGAEPLRHISVRIPYVDARAIAFLESEARQLPKEGPGLIMIDISRTPGASKVWEPLLRGRRRPTIHTRVSGICLFAEALLPTDRGVALLQQTSVIANPHAKFTLPAWIATRIEEAGAALNAALHPRKDLASRS